MAKQFSIRVQVPGNWRKVQKGVRTAAQSKFFEKRFQRFYDGVNKYLERSLKKEYRKLWGGKTFDAATTFKSIASHKRGKSRWEVGLFPPKRGATTFSQDPRIYIAAQLKPSGWEQTRKLNREGILRVSYWAEKRFGVNRRAARAIAFALSRRWVSAGPSQFSKNRDFLHRVIRREPKGEGIWNALQEPYASQVFSMHKKAIAEVEKELKGK